MDTRWIDDFMVLAETGNFTRAADLRHSSQAAFSRRIQSLEAAVKATLFDRSNYPTRLTPAGQIFRRKAGDILIQLDETMEALAQERPIPELRLGLPYALASSHGGRWMRAWATGPDLRARLQPGGLNDILAALAVGHADLVITYHSPHQPVDMVTQPFESLVVGHEIVRPYMRRDSGFEQAFPGRPDRPLPLLDYPQGIYFARLMETIRARAPRPLHGETIFSCDMSDVLRSMAEQGLGVAWLPASTVDPVLHPDLVPIEDDGDFTLRIQIVALRTSGPGTPALEALWTRLEREGLPEGAHDAFPVSARGRDGTPVPPARRKDKSAIQQR